MPDDRHGDRRAEYNEEACRLRHDSEDWRLTQLELTIKKIFDKLDLFGQRPSWIELSVITFLASGLAVAITIIFQMMRKAG